MSPTASELSQATYSISELAEDFETTARALRFYEDKGLLAPLRQGSRRVYTGRDRARLSLIVRGRRVGFSLAEMKEMLDLYDIEDGQTAQLTIGLQKFRERIQQLENQKGHIDEAIQELEAQCDLVEKMLAKKPG